MSRTKTRWPALRSGRSRAIHRSVRAVLAALRHFAGYALGTLDVERGSGALTRCDELVCTSTSGNQLVTRCALPRHEGVCANASAHVLWDLFAHQWVPANPTTPRRSLTMPRVSAWNTKNFVAYALPPKGESADAMALAPTRTFEESRRALDALNLEGAVYYTGPLPDGAVNVVADRDAQGRWEAISPCAPAEEGEFFTLPSRQSA